MNIPWSTSKLRDIANVRVSNVDKKVYFSEKPVKLCNYMDVYSNEYIRDNIPFMDGSATPAEIERFGLQIGDVIITKDSESPDDIGIPAVIADNIEDLVCGYHLALIRPNKDKVDPVYLAKQISTSRVARYFALQASGSTRFGLPISAIEEVEIPKPFKPEQTKIAEVLSTVDRAIEQTEDLIVKQQRIKTGLMQDLLTRGIDEHGNLRYEETHEFKDSPLGRIPVEWDQGEGREFFTLHAGFSVDELYDSNQGKYLYLKVDDFNNPENLEGITTASNTFNCPSQFTHRLLIRRTIVFPKRGAAIFLNRVELLQQPASLDPNLMAMRTNDAVIPEYLRFALLHRNLGTICDNSGIPQINNKHLYPLAFVIPKKNEQIRIVQCIQEHEVATQKATANLNKLRHLKTALMQDLLTGKVRVTPLLTGSPQEASA